MLGKIVGAAVGEAARAVAAEESTKRAQDPHWYWLTRGVILVILLAGWVFILVQNKFHVDPPVVVVMLAYLAVVATVTNLWRVGAAAVARDSSDDSWARPLGERGDLDKEKRTLLKQIKEAEFDQAMGKLSKPDAEQLILMYRTRAIEVIKELDRLDAGQAGTPREKIEREVAARLHIEQEKADNKKKKKPADKQPDKGADKAAAKPADKPAEPVAEAVADAAPPEAAPEPSPTDATAAPDAPEASS